MWYNGGMKRVLKYALILLISGSVLWAGKILVDEKNWVAISALATLVLAFGAFWAIMDNRHARIVNRKERLLNEVIQWAIDVATCEYSVSIEEPSSIFTRLHDKDLRAYDIKDKVKLAQGIMQDHKRVWQSRYMNLHRNYQTLDARGEYILSLSDNKDFESIINTVRAVKAQISDYQNGLWEYMKDIDDKSREKKLEDEAKKLQTRAVELIKAATKIKAKDIT